MTTKVASSRVVTMATESKIFMTSRALFANYFGLCLLFSGLSQTTPAQAKVTKVITHQDIPLVMDNKGHYEGFLVDLYNQSYTRAGLAVPPLVPGPDKSQGFIDQLNTGDADLAVAAISPTAKWAKLVTFTQPYHSDGFRVLYKIHETSNTISAIETLAKPFTPGLWLLLIGMFFVASLCLFLIGRFSPYEGCTSDKKAATAGSSRRISIGRSLTYFYSVLLWQGSTSAPKSLSGRCLSLVWWLFALLAVTSYIAGLSATLLRVNRQTSGLPFSTLDGMSRQNQVGILVTKESHVMTYLKNSQGQLEARILALINYHKHDWIVSSDAQGIARVNAHPDQYVMLLDGPTASVLANHKPCDLSYLAEPLGSMAYTLACRKGAHACDVLNQGILAMGEDGTMSELKIKWFQSECSPDASYISDALPVYDTLGMGSFYITPLTVTIQRFSAAFILLAVGIAVALLLLGCEVGYAKGHGGRYVPRQFDNRTSNDPPARTFLGEDDNLMQENVLS